MTAIYIGVMTGTSMDGVDIVAASFDPLRLHATLTLPFDPELRDELMALTLPDDNEIDRMGAADVALGQMIGHGINQMIEKMLWTVARSGPSVHMAKLFVIVLNIILPYRLVTLILLPN